MPRGRRCCCCCCCCCWRRPCTAGAQRRLVTAAARLAAPHPLPVHRAPPPHTGRTSGAGSTPMCWPTPGARAGCGTDTKWSGGVRTRARVRAHRRSLLRLSPRLCARSRRPTLHAGIRTERPHLSLTLFVGVLATAPSTPHWLAFAPVPHRRRAAHCTARFSHCRRGGAGRRAAGRAGPQLAALPLGALPARHHAPGGVGRGGGARAHAPLAACTWCASCGPRWLQRSRAPAGDVRLLSRAPTPLAQAALEESASLDPQLTQRMLAAVKVGRARRLGGAASAAAGQQAGLRGSKQGCGAASAGERTARRRRPRPGPWASSARLPSL